jgi:protein TonB
MSAKPPTIDTVPPDPGEMPVTAVLEADPVRQDPLAAVVAEGPARQDPVPSAVSPDQYYNLLRVRIDARKAYPESARRRREEGKVTVRFTLMSDGHLVSVDIADACPYEALNQAALRAVSTAAPFPPIPPELSRDRLTIRLAIRFELT